MGCLDRSQQNQQNLCPLIVIIVNVTAVPSALSNLLFSNHPELLLYSWSVLELMWVFGENRSSTLSPCSFRMSEESRRLPTNPISAVGVVTSLSQGPAGYYVVSNTVQLLNWWRILWWQKKVPAHSCFWTEALLNSVMADHLHRSHFKSPFSK